ncbi:MULTISPECIES: acetyl-CoA carboxylase biotin carboxyl carrier protein subunit [Thermoactinomyces]|jgi:acetyl-CoA carboxylase biotin carboxyl carrier protein|uniref:Acetyl-CoA carboxylase biotin carboxyl carrier protein subunit n=1 Tax=Thermoactinomyces vulgaris TaxID=2026 RepID=A0ABS0QHW6_THEVU|nr:MULTISPECIES: acetyl-CoA carboxylase biotin carboxyl carrier protein subunit [Thermoactinomyces]KFZ40661.1 acetyl-CoA carboxylase [Thermoactinomyces sp. Gus2-1]KYQ86940.1 acetyl-CoA carboxylase biotin carboxyl carrier protein subunit [Thermoactinomyces sp. AS95]MBA4551691.1 acetyl-CoA carboxylase biotin carboxyl carrier protein subunit [Thermoactinomyces vulgaris]MBA4596430.1 acetyl-CoA carboxylase biotin carboxyl carrier protein subunit [Thermoactinomyces vulgaris]MBH8582839.1 acetyl-CoA c
MAKVEATMAGTVMQVLVAVGDKVEAGQDVVILESMKMEVPVQSEYSGVVKEIKVESGSFVSDGDVLIELS